MHTSGSISNSIRKLVGNILRDEADKWRCLNYVNWLDAGYTDDIRHAYLVTVDALEFSVVVGLLELTPEYVHPFVDVVSKRHPNSFLNHLGLSYSKGEDWIVRKVNLRSSGNTM